MKGVNVISESASFLTYTLQSGVQRFVGDTANARGGNSKKGSIIKAHPKHLSAATVSLLTFISFPILS